MRIANKLPKSHSFHFIENEECSATTGFKLWQVQANIQVKVLTIGPSQGSLEKEIMNVTAFVSSVYM